MSFNLLTTAMSHMGDIASIKELLMSKLGVNINGLVKSDNNLRSEQPIGPSDSVISYSTHLVHILNMLRCE